MFFSRCPEEQTQPGHQKMKEIQVGEGKTRLPEREGAASRDQRYQELA